MQPLSVALAYCLGVIAGAALPASVASEAAMWCLAAGFAGFAAAWIDRRGASLALIGVALAWGCARGCTRAHPPPGSEARGRPQIVQVEVASASEPGPRCRVELVGGGVLSTREFGCRRAPGDRLVLPAAARVGDIGAVWPDPRSPQPAGGSKARVESDVVFSTGERSGGYWRWVAGERERAWAWSRGDSSRGLVVASALGMRAALPPEDRAALRAAGLGHLIAVSGLHVGVAALLFHALALRIAWVVGVSPRGAVVASWLPLLAYVGLTGAAASAVRAAVMLVLLGLGTATGRPAHGTASLAIAGMLMLAIDPGWALDPGFLLSMAAMAAIVSARPGLGVLAHSWRVSWAVAPLSWWFFGEASAYGLLSNVVAIPLLALWILPTAVLGWIGSGWLGEIALVPARAGAGLVLDLAHLIAALPRASAGTVTAAAGLALVAFVVVRVLARRRWARWLAGRDLIPPVLASAGLLVAVWASSAEGPVDSWYAVGGRRSLAVIAPSADGGHACIREPRWTPSTWASLLRGLEIGRVEAVVSSSGDPSAVALREDLRVRGLLGRGNDDCVEVDVERARAALTRCLKRRGTRRAIVRGEVSGSRVECFAAQRWRLLPSEAS